MKKNILLAFLMSLAFWSYSQVIYWPLNNDSLPVVNDSRMWGGIFEGGSGIGSITFGSTGAYANNWTTDSLIDTADYFQFSFSVNSGYTFSLDSITFSHRRSLSGIHKFAIYYSLHSDFSSPVLVDSFEVPDVSDEIPVTISGLPLNLSSTDTAYFRLYGYAAESSAGTWRINDNSLKVYGQVSVENTNDITSYAEAPSQQIASTTIPSTATTSALAVPVFKFNIVDGGETDGVPTYVKQITIKNPHPTNSAIWTQTIQGILLTLNGNEVNLQGVDITDDYIRVQTDTNDFVIQDGTSGEVVLYVFLKNSGIIDGSTLQFAIDSASHGFEASPYASGFADVFPSIIVSAIHNINVEAVKVNLTSYPTVVWNNTPFNISVSVTDNNGNIDSDYSGDVSLSVFQGNGTLTPSSPVQSVVSGVANFSGLLYNGTGGFVLKAESGTLTPAVSQSITAAVAYDSIFDNFNDGDLVNGYLWLGDINAFAVTTDEPKELVLFTYTASADTSYISIPFESTMDSLEWSLKVRMALEPSSNNYVRYYLISPDYDLHNPPANSYYFQLGETGSNDAITFYKIDSAGNTIQLCRTTDGDIADNPDVRIKTIYNPAQSKWRIYADYTGAENYELVAEATDTLASLQGAHFFSGFSVRYSSTNDENKFFFDDFYLGKVRVDTTAPQIASVNVTDSVTLDIYFTEGVKGSNITDVSNYLIDNGIGNPALVVRDSSDYSHITLILPFALTNETQYILTVQSVMDFNGNISNNLSANFIYYLPYLNDITINEIMADPSPAVELPEYEYVELYNTSNYALNLKGWSISIGTKNYEVENDFVLDTNQYLILSTEEGCLALNQYGTCLGIIGSSTVLTNSGQTVTLYDKFHRTISSVTYSDSWYGSNTKKEGGWSLEKIDPNNPCQGEGNWTASNDTKGGTPGAKNSVYDTNPDTQHPTVVAIGLPENDTLIVYFSETMDSSSILNPAHYSIDYGIGQPIEASSNPPYYNQAKLTLSTPVSGGVVYTLSFDPGIKDCSGNDIATTSSKFSVPVQALQGDVVINEVLYNPLDGCSDYVEIYNASNHSVDLSTLRLANKDDEDTSGYKNITLLSDESRLMMPGTFLVITENPAAVKKCYYVKNPDNFIKVNSMISLPSSSGNVALINKWLETIDYFEYNDKMQFYMLSSTKGVALERINYYLPTNDESNWHSASQDCGFGTPTYQNSQYVENPLDNNSQVWLSDDLFSPDNDGYKDVLLVNYNFSQPGYTLTVIVFDAAGRPVKTLAQKESVATEGSIIWDGTNDYGIKTPGGVYLVYVEAVSGDGKVKTYKLQVVVAYRR
jgi:hypothetical protein